MKFLLYGGKGWIGQKIQKMLKQKDYIVILGESRVDDIASLEKEIVNVNPDRIISTIGRTHGDGFSTIDYLEQKDKLYENIRDNLFGPIVLRELSNKFKIHTTYLGTGCIFNYNNDHPKNSDCGFTDFLSLSLSLSLSL